MYINVIRLDKVLGYKVFLNMFVLILYEKIIWGWDEVIIICCDNFY